MSDFFKVHTYASLPSTQDYVKELAEEGLEEGIVVQCLEQRSGRGRHGSHWFSPMGNLYMSLLLRPDCDVRSAGQLSFVSAVALSSAMDEVLDKGHKKTLKWPNDILINSKKVSGILIEKEGEAYVVGMGVNIMNPPDEGICLKDVSSDPKLAIHPFRDKVLHHFENYYQKWLKEGFLPIREKWLEQAHGLGKSLIVKLEDKELEGKFTTIDKEGYLKLEDADGKHFDINSGAVYFPLD